MVEQPWIFAAYVLLGPVAALLVALGLVSARLKMTKLSASRAVLTDPAPTVAVLVPARNEGPGIAACLRSILALDYPGLKLVAVDDRSTDDTLARMREVEAAHPGRLEVHAITHKPDDWLGKNHALHVAASRPAARAADWLLFVDSDVTVAPDALRRCIGHARERGIDAISVLTRQRCETFAEKLITPVACGFIIAMYAASQTNNDNRPNNAFANGQFFLIRREVYDRVGGHESVRFWPCEDVDLMRLMKRSGAKVRLYAGNDFAETRFYDSLSRMFRGWARIYSGTSHRRPWRIVLASGFVLAFMFAFVVPFVAPDRWWLAASLVHLGAVLANVGAIYAWSGNRAAYALLFPLAAAFQLAFFAKALWWCYSNRMEWRGTAYSTPADTGSPEGPKPTP